jgi:hypothetical protein
LGGNVAVEIVVGKMENESEFRKIKIGMGVYEGRFAMKLKY